jgi:hypothetical protein
MITCCKLFIALNLNFFLVNRRRATVPNNLARVPRQRANTAHTAAYFSCPYALTFSTMQSHALLWKWNEDDSKNYFFGFEFTHSNSLIILLYSTLFHFIPKRGVAASQHLRNRNKITKVTSTHLVVAHWQTNPVACPTVFP